MIWGSKTAAVHAPPLLASGASWTHGFSPLDATAPLGAPVDPRCHLFMNICRVLSSAHLLLDPSLTQVVCQGQPSSGLNGTALPPYFFQTGWPFAICIPLVTYAEREFHLQRPAKGSDQ